MGLLLNIQLLVKLLNVSPEFHFTTSFPNKQEMDNYFMIKFEEGGQLARG
jgi:hypothetical protein